MSYLNSSNDHRLRRRRPGATSSADQQRLEVHRSVRRDAAFVQEHGRRVGLESRVASRLRFPLAARRIRLDTIKKGSHRIVEGSLVSIKYERGKGKSKKAKTNKRTLWCIRANFVRKLHRGEPEPETVASGSAAPSDALHASDPAPF